MSLGKWRIVHDSEHGIWLDGPVRRVPSIFEGHTYPVWERMTLKAEDIVALARDAARYRFLRDDDIERGIWQALSAEEFDAKVDAEMKEQV